MSDLPKTKVLVGNSIFYFLFYSKVVRPTKMVLPTPYPKYDFFCIRPTKDLPIYMYVLLKDMSTPY